MDLPASQRHEFRPGYLEIFMDFLFPNMPTSHFIYCVFACLPLYVFFSFVFLFAAGVRCSRRGGVASMPWTCLSGTSVTWMACF